MRMKFNPVANALMGWMLKRQMSKATNGVIEGLEIYADTVAEAAASASWVALVGYASGPRAP
jgi:hypothetical protein